MGSNLEVLARPAEADLPAREQARGTAAADGPRGGVVSGPRSGRSASDRWLDTPITRGQLDEVYLANAVCDADLDDPGCGYRFPTDEVHRHDAHVEGVGPVGVVHLPRQCLVADVRRVRVVPGSPARLPGLRRSRRSQVPTHGRRPSRWRRTELARLTAPSAVDRSTPSSTNNRDP